MAKSYQAKQDALTALLNMRYDKLQAKIHALQQKLPKQRMSVSSEVELASDVASKRTASANAKTMTQEQSSNWRFGSEQTLESVIQGALENIVIARQILQWDWGLEGPIHQDSQEISKYFVDQIGFDLDESEFQELLLQTESSLLDEVFAVKAAQCMAKPAMSNLLQSIHNTEWKTELQTIYEPFINLNPDQVRIDILTTMQRLEALRKDAQNMDDKERQSAMKILDVITEELVGINETLEDLRHNAIVVRNARMAEAKAVESNSIKRIANLMTLGGTTPSDFQQIASEVTKYYNQPDTIIAEFLAYIRQAQNHNASNALGTEEAVSRPEKQQGYAQNFYGSSVLHDEHFNTEDKDSGFVTARSTSSYDEAPYFTANQHGSIRSDVDQVNSAPSPVINVDDGIFINAAELPIQYQNNKEQSSEASYKITKSVVAEDRSPVEADDVQYTDNEAAESWLNESDKYSDEFLKQYLRKNPHLSDAAASIASKNLHQTTLQQNTAKSVQQQHYQSGSLAPDSASVTSVSKIERPTNKPKIKKI